MNFQNSHILSFFFCGPKYLFDGQIDPFCLEKSTLASSSSYFHSPENCTKGGGEKMSVMIGQCSTFTLRRSRRVF